jgi:hypothetical protein
MDVTGVAGPTMANVAGFSPIVVLFGVSVGNFS